MTWTEEARKANKKRNAHHTRDLMTPGKLLGARWLGTNEDGLTIEHRVVFDRYADRACHLRCIVRVQWCYCDGTWKHESEHEGISATFRLVDRVIEEGIQ